MAARLNLGEGVGGAAERVGDSLLALAEDKSSLAAGIRPSPEETTAHSSCDHLAAGT